MKSGPRKYLTLLIILTIVLYLPIMGGFFQQDEWLAFNRHILLYGESIFTRLSDAFVTPGLHYTPLTTLTINLMFSIFKLKYTGYVIVSLVLHCAVVSLVYFLSFEIFKESKKATIATGIFATFSATYQATAWVMADTSVHGATIFALLSLILFVRFIRDDYRQNFNFSLIFLFVSFLFKEIAIGLIPFYLLLVFLFKHKSGLFKSSGKLGIFGAGYVTLRIVVYLISNVGLSISSGNPLSYKQLLYNFVSIPIKSIVQIIFPTRLTLSFSRFLSTNVFGERVTGVVGTPEFDIFVVKRVHEALTWILFGLVIGLLIYVWKNYKKSLVVKSVFLSLVGVLVNSIVFAYTPEKSGVTFIVDSRNLYFVSVGVAIFITSIMFVLKKKILFAAALILVGVNVYLLNNQLDENNYEAIVRKSILSEINQSMGSFPPNVVIYTESALSYYGLPPDKRILPFQSGFGHTLLVNSWDEVYWPKDFFKDRFLWEILDQGYKETDNYSFGYYREFEKLVEDIDRHNIPTESIFAFRHTEDNLIEEMTEELLGRVASFSEPKRVLVKQYSVSSELNNEEVEKLSDGNRETYWSSVVPYESGQSIEIDLAKIRKVTKMEIDSYTNKDQDNIGYQISISQNGEVWEKIYENSRIIPNENGLTNLYIPIKEAMYLKVDQIGRHEFAPWVIHELKLYEKI